MSTTQVHRTKEDIGLRGDEIYDRDIRPQVDNVKNRGKLVLIDIDTGSWEMDIDEMEASARMESRRPGATIWMVRVGYPYTYRVGSGRSWGLA